MWFMKSYFLFDRVNINKPRKRMSSLRSLKGQNLRSRPQLLNSWVSPLTSLLSYVMYVLAGDYQPRNNFISLKMKSLNVLLNYLVLNLELLPPFTVTVIPPILLFSLLSPSCSKIVHKLNWGFVEGKLPIDSELNDDLPEIIYSRWIFPVDFWISWCIAVYNICLVW